MKSFLKFLLILAIVISVLFASRNFILKSWLSSIIKSTTELGLFTRSFTTSFSPPSIEINDLILLNPEGFNGPVMMYLPEFYIEFDASSLSKGKIAINLLKINVKEFNVVRDKNNNLNIGYLKPIEKEERGREIGPQKNTGLSIAKLQLKIGEVYFKDYYHNPQGEIRKYIVGLNETYENLNDYEALVKIIVAKALANTTISHIVNFDLEGLRQDISATLKGVTNKTVGTVTSATKNIIGGVVEVVESPFKEKDKKEE